MIQWKSHFMTETGATMYDMDLVKGAIHQAMCTLGHGIKTDDMVRAQ